MSGIVPAKGSFPDCSVNRAIALATTQKSVAAAPAAATFPEAA
eukprot:CAMPEP_0204505422 /NCGR_PEP_ID=MMETSP0471-20130131/107641_1 /ASSEMBLY_ACC=CAM_ASM_000602 /TAXON_ID=2969 /ORGANISM="Oxyrrhis marina" /LENGTH=42 /DNA_ID= /DNA_START= /DNA_END= /DNA_ORIENTATION=